jgi:gliding motility-associated-like protein
LAPRERFIGTYALWVWLMLLLAPMSTVSAQGWDWARYANSPNTDRGLGIAADHKTGDFYVVGSSLGSLSELGLVNAGNLDGYVAKYKPNGNLAWAFRIAGAGADEILDIVVDSSNQRFYITGYVSGAVTITGRGGVPYSGTASGNRDMLIAAFDSTGALLWAAREGAGLIQYGTGITFDNNAVYVTGNYDNQMNFDGTTGSPTISINVSGTLDWWVAKYRKSDGGLLWVRECTQGNDLQAAQAIAVDSNGVYFCGSFSSPVIRANGTSGSINVPRLGPGNTNIFMFKLRRSDGLAFWGRSAGSSVNNDEALAIATDGTSLYLGGRLGGNATFAPLPVVAVGCTQNGFLSKHDPANGDAIWVNALGNLAGLNLTSVNDIDLDETGEIWAGGFFMNQLRLPNTVAPTSTLTATGLSDLFLASFDGNGLLTRALQAGGTGGDGCNAIAVRDQGTVGLVGSYSIDNGQFITLPPTPPLPFEGLEDMQVALYSGCAPHPNIAQTFTAQSNSICVGDTARISLPTSEIGTHYTLIDSTTGLAFGPMQVGNGGTLTFVAGPLSSNVVLAFEAYVNLASCAELLTQTQLISVFARPSISIGPDITQCGGFGPALNAGPGFVTYLWSTFQPSQSIVATSSGTYSVTVTDANGCKDSDTMIFNLLPPPVPNLGPDLDPCVGASVTLDPGAGFTAYAWSNGSVTPTIAVTTSGIYSVTVTAANGCQASDQVIVTFRALPVPNLGPDLTKCPSAAAILDPGAGFSTYTWNISLNTPTVSVTAGGSYDVTVTNAFGCTASDQINVLLLPQPFAGNLPDTIVCPGTVINLSAAPGATSYLWSTGASSQAVSVVLPGNYGVTVTDGNGCTAATSMNLSNRPQPVVSVGPDLSGCAGFAPTIAATPGFSSYLWNTGETTPSIVLGAAGIHAVSATDVNGCIAVDTMLLTWLPLPVVALGPDASICAGGSRLLDAGPGGIAYAWSTGATTQTITVSTAGTFSVTVTGANGCQGTDQIIISVNALPTPNLGPDLSLCAGGSTLISTGNVYSAYTWSTGAISPSISVSATGTYQVTVTDANGCQASDLLNLTVNPLPTPNLGPDVGICAGSSITFDAGPGYITYAWVPAGNAQTLTVSTAGLVRVTVTDGNGCQGIDLLNLTVNALPTPNLGPDQSLCAGGSTTLATVASYAAYAWSGGPTTPTLTVSTAGSYTVTVTDGNGCQGTDLLNVAVNALPTPDLGPDIAICAGSSTTLSLPVAYNAYVWSTGAVTPTISPTTAGAYQVTVTDANGCQASDLLNLTVNALPTPDLGPDVSICAGTSTTLATTIGYASYAWSNSASTATITVSTAGTYTVTVTDGNGCQGIDLLNLTVNALPSPDLGPDQSLCAGGSTTLATVASYAAYAWSGGPTTPTLTVSTAGSYTVTVTDGNGCQGTDLLNVAVNALPAAGVLQDSAICLGDTLQLNALGGMASYLWSTGETGSSILVSSPNTYAVTVTSASGCVGNGSMVLTLHAVPSVSVGPDVVTCVGTSFSITATAGFVSYLWSNAQATQTITPTVSGLYAVSVEDANGCQAQDTMQWNLLPLPTVALGADTAICTGATLQLDAGPGYTTYAWNTGWNGQVLTIDTIGDYAVTVTDAGGCQGSDTLHLDLLALPVVQLGADTTICQGGGLLLGNLLGAGMHYLWNTGDTTAQIMASLASVYGVVVIDSQGCQASDSLVLGLNALPSVVLGPDTTTCPGQALTLDAGNVGATFTWAHGPATQVVSVLLPGNYAVTVVDANGCQGIDSIAFAHFANPIVTLPDTATSCVGDSILLDAGILAASYLWSNSATTPSITVQTNGSYWVAVIDTNGCAGGDTTVARFYARPVVALGSDTTACATGLPIVLDAGHAGASFAWSSGDSLQTLAVSGSGSYAVTVTDAQGCIGSDTILVTLLSASPVSLGADASICAGDSLALTVIGNYQSLLWSTGATTDTIFVATAGLWSVIASDSFGCQAFDSMRTALVPRPAPQLPGDTAICTGASLILYAGAAGQYLWSTSATTDSIVVNAGGTYAVTVTQQGCPGSDTVVVNSLPTPVVSLGPDLLICPGDSVILGASVFPVYQWSTGATSDSIWVNAVGDYSLLVKDLSGCIGYDTVNVAMVSAPQVALLNLLAAYCQTDPNTQLVGLPLGGSFGGAADAGGIFAPGSAGLGQLYLSYSYTDTVGCSWQVSDTTVVTAPPSPADAGPDLQQSATITLQAATPTVGVGHWELGSLPGSLSDINDPHATLTTTAIGDFPIVWIVEQAPCAPTRDTMYLMLGAFSLPTGFSPNGDGVNDTYVIRGIERYPDAKLSIYNRWGNLVWESAHYHNEWTGTNNAAQPLVDDTYYAILSYGDKAVNTYVVLAR